MFEGNCIYVSPTGSDEWSGGLPEANANGTDGPLRTPVAAQAAVRRLKSRMTTPAEISVCLRGGVYELSQPLLFTREDGGFPRSDDYSARTWRVTWGAFPGEKPILSGGRRLTGPWHEETIHGLDAWVATIPGVADGDWNFRQLWVNGRRRSRPRLPKEGSWKVERAFATDYVNYVNAGTPKFGFKAGELRADWRNLRDIQLQFFGWWLAPRVGLAAVDEKERVALFDRNSMLRLAWNVNTGLEYRVENVFEAMTRPGEWYLDRPSGKLHYLPLPGENDPVAAEIVAPRLESLLRIDGAANLCFAGLTFAHNEWQSPADFAESVQAACEVPGAIILHNAENCVFRDCTIRHTGTYGVEMCNQTIETVLDHCDISDLGAGGIRIWHGCRRNVVCDCEIADGGLIFPSGVGILIGKSGGNRIEHNNIHHLFYSGISAGWTWGYGESEAYGNIIEWNHIHHLGNDLLADLGGIYLLGHAPGTRVRFNHVHDIRGRNYGGWCIYADEGSSDVLVENNLCHHASNDLFHLHYGRHNLVRNNIFACGGDGVISCTKLEDHLSLMLEANIFIANGTPVLRGKDLDCLRPDRILFKRNLYWCAKGPLLIKQGNAGIYATQSFPDGFRSESGRFSPLPSIPRITGEPGPSDWEHALKISSFFSKSGDTAPAGAGELRLQRREHILYVRGIFRRPPQWNSISGPVWNREHVELFLKPFAAHPGMVQLGLASDGEMALLWHGCTLPHPGLDWQATAVATHDGWQMNMRIPLNQIVNSIAAANHAAPAWTWLAGFAMLPEITGWSRWKAQGLDQEGLSADPLFVDPEAGDFNLRPESPALTIGFVPFDFRCAGRLQSTPPQNG